MTPDRPPTRSHTSPRRLAVLRYENLRTVNSSLVPLLLAYGEDLPDDAAAPRDAAAAAEEALLLTTRAALERLPREKPPHETIEAVMRAAQAAASGSTLAPVRAVMAGDVSDVTVEHALLRSTWQAVERVGRPAPPSRTVETIVRAAAEAARTSELSPLRRALAAERIDPADVEGRLLATTMEAVSRVPRPAPPADTVAAVLAAAGQAARSSDLAPVRAAVAGVPGAAGVEEALLRTTWEAVERLPRHTPPVDAVHAVLAAANAAVPPARRAHVAADRAATARLPRVFAYVTAAFAFVGLVSVALWTSGDGRSELVNETAGVDEIAAPSPQQADPDDGTGSARGSDLFAQGPTPATPAQSIETGSRAGRAGAAAAPPTPAPAPPPPPAADVQWARAEADGLQSQERTRPATVGLISGTGADASPGAGLAGTPAVAPAWEAGADVRLLSLRLASIQEQNTGVEWEEPPTALGGPEEGSLRPVGLNAVGAQTSPARFQVRVSPND